MKYPSPLKTLLLTILLVGGCSRCKEDLPTIPDNLCVNDPAITVTTSCTYEKTISNFLISPFEDAHPNIDFSKPIGIDGIYSDVSTDWTVNVFKYPTACDTNGTLVIKVLKENDQEVKKLVDQPLSLKTGASITRGVTSAITYNTSAIIGSQGFGKLKAEISGIDGSPVIVREQSFWIQGIYSSAFPVIVDITKPVHNQFFIQSNSLFTATVVFKKMANFIPGTRQFSVVDPSGTEVLKEDSTSFDESVMSVQFTPDKKGKYTATAAVKSVDGEVLNASVVDFYVQ